MKLPQTHVVTISAEEEVRRAVHANKDVKYAHQLSPTVLSRAGQALLRTILRTKQRMHEAEVLVREAVEAHPVATAAHELNPAEVPHGAAQAVLRGRQRVHNNADRVWEVVRNQEHHLSNDTLGEIVEAVCDSVSVSNWVGKFRCRETMERFIWHTLEHRMLTMQENGSFNYMPVRWEDFADFAAEAGSLYHLEGVTICELVFSEPCTHYIYALPHAAGVLRQVTGLLNFAFTKLKLRSFIGFYAGWGGWKKTDATSSVLTRMPSTAMFLLWLWLRLTTLRTEISKTWFLQMAPNVCFVIGIGYMLSEAMPYSDYIDTGSLCFKAQPPNMNPTNPPPRRMLRVGVVSAVRQH